MLQLSYVTKTIRITDRTYRDLDTLGTRHDTFDSIIQRLIQSYKKVAK